MTPADLPAEWRAKASELRRFGAEEAASALECCADDLEDYWRTWQTEPLTIEEAEAETGYAYSTLQQKVASGEIPNIGEPGRPRVRRADLPRKAPRQRFELGSGEPDLAARILTEALV